MRLSAALLTIALVFVPAVATLAQSPMMTESSGVYVNVGGAVALLPGTTDTQFNSPSGTEFDPAPEHYDGNKTNWDFDLGIGASGALGYDFGSFRADAEFTYLSSNFVFGVDKTDRRQNSDKANDTLTVLAGTANAWYDLDTGTAWSPYIGVGVGAANLQVKLREEGKETQAAPNFDGSGWGFVYKAGVGVAVEVLSGFSLVAGYQFFGTLETTVTAGKTNNNATDDHTVKPTLMAHGLNVGLRFLF